MLGTPALPRVWGAAGPRSLGSALYSWLDVKTDTAVVGLMGKLRPVEITPRPVGMLGVSQWTLPRHIFAGFIVGWLVLAKL